MYDLNMQCTTADGVKLGVVMALHAPDDADKIVRLRETITRDGWQGRPLVLIDAGDHHIALNGTHRLAATIGIDGTINAIILDDLTADEYDALDAEQDDDGRAAVMTALAAQRGDGSLDAAADALRQEAEAD